MSPAPPQVSSDLDLTSDPAVVDGVGGRVDVRRTLSGDQL